MGVAGDLAEVVAELLAGLPQALVRAAQVAALVVYLEPLEDGVEMAVEVLLGEIGEAVLARPLLANPFVGAQAVRPVDDGAAADARAGNDRDLALGRRKGAAVEIEALVGRELLAVEVGVVVVGTRLQHTTDLPAAASSAAMTPPPAPEPTTQTSASIVSVGAAWACG